MNYPYLSGTPSTYQSPYQQQPAPVLPVPLAQTGGTTQAQAQQQPPLLPPTMASDDRYIFGTIVEVDIRLRIIYIESFAGEKALAVEFTDNDHFDRLVRYNMNYHGDKVVTYYPSGRWGLLAGDCQIFSYKWYGVRPE